MILPHKMTSARIQNFKDWLKEVEPRAEKLIELMKSDQGAMIILYDDVKYETHIVCFYGSMSFCEVYKQLTPTNYVRVPNNNESLLPNTAPKNH